MATTTAPSETVRMRVRRPERLRIAINRSGFAQWRIAAIVQVSPPTLSQIISGDTTCSSRVAAQIAELVGVPGDELFAWLARMPPTDPALVIARASCVQSV